MKIFTMKTFIEDHVDGNCPVDPFAVSDADTMLAYLKGEPQGTISAPRLGHGIDAAMEMPR